ncbi:actin-binding Rho-activating protein-like isoform X2 [Rhodnius prolixus]|uniref:Costars domain-containing protein n=2 Tax=Rhodnius prolixus TaxID=13249 RepID=T1HKE5_RHOPR
MSGLDNMIAKFNAKAQSHQDSQKQNPFSGSFSGKKLNTKPGQENYGRPVAGSKTEKRGFQAKSHINKETLELCETIYELACYNLELMKREQEENADFDEVMIDDGPVVVTFGDLFEVYTRINNKVVGLLLAAKKKGLVFFEKEMLFQRRDDDELIMLNKPIKEIRQIMKEARAKSPVTSISPCGSDDESN